MSDEYDERHADYDLGYANGESSGYADWVGALSETTVPEPDEGWTPTTTALMLQQTYNHALALELWLRRTLAERDENVSVRPQDAP